MIPRVNTTNAAYDMLISKPQILLKRTFSMLKARNVKKGMQTLGYSGNPTQNKIKNKLFRYFVKTNGLSRLK